MSDLTELSCRGSSRWSWLGSTSPLWRHFEEAFAQCIRTEADLRPEQREAVEFAWTHPFSALFLDVGFGKTAITLSVVDRLLQRGYSGKILIIAPIRVATQVWPNEIKLWTHLAYMRAVVIRIEDDDPRLTALYDREFLYQRALGRKWVDSDREARKAKTKLKHKLLKQLVDAPEQIHIINQEAVDWLANRSGLKRWPYKMVIFDESSRLRDHNSVIFKALQRVLPHIKRFHQLTATPSSQTYMHLFSQIYLLDKGERFGRFITHFREMYFTQNKYSQKYELRNGAAEEIERKIADIVLVMRRERDFQVSVRPIRLSDRLMVDYKSFERELVLELPDETIDAINGAVLCGKLLQYASGVIYDGNRVAHPLHDEKLLELQELLEETQDEPVLVAYWFKSTLARLKRLFPDAAVMDREGKQVDPWNKRKYKMMLVHPMSVGHGLNLQHGGHHIVVVDLFYSLELFTQLIGRLDRPGQNHTVMVHLLAAAGTIDEIVASNLQRLRSAEEAMFSRLRDLRRRLHANG